MRVLRARTTVERVKAISKNREKDKQKWGKRGKPIGKGQIRE